MQIPLRGGRLLLPNAAVAEIIGYREPSGADPGLPWWRGEVTWRQRQVPVIDFERLLGRPEQAASIRRRIAICYTGDAADATPLLGIIAEGIPRLLRLRADVIQDATQPLDKDSAVRMTIRVDNEDFLVPDIDRILSDTAARAAARG